MTSDGEGILADGAQSHDDAVDFVGAVLDSTDWPNTPGPDNDYLFSTYGHGPWSDRKHLMWLHDRLVRRFGEHPLVDYLHRLRDIVDRTPEPSDWPPMPDTVIRSVHFRGLCRTCLDQQRVPAAADWVDCPTGGWWSHVVHPDDDHDADVEWSPEQDMDDHGHYFTVDR